MKQDQVTIGGEYRVKVGGRLAPVRVLRRLDGSGRARFECLTGDTGRRIRATAARLRPMPPARVREAIARMVAAAAQCDDDAIVIGGDPLAAPVSMPGYPGECPAGMDWSRWLAMNNVD